MKRALLALGSASAALALVVYLLVVTIGPPQRPSPEGDDALPPGVQEFPGPIVQHVSYEVLGPYTHENLTVFLLRGEDRLKGRAFLTLQEALVQNKAVVHETGSVDELAVENLSDSEDLYIQSGDIVKGGQQDRTLRYDVVVPPRSGRVPLASFCVESGRWQQRGEEASAYFSSSSESLSGKELKLASSYERNQGRVWEKVAAAQARLRESVGREIPTCSASSLQLTLESGAVQEAVKPYLGKLSLAPASQEGVIGFAYAINGKLNSAEAYASAGLFRKLWPKLLRASAIEAVAERGKGGKRPPVTAVAVRDFLSGAERGKAFLEPVAGRVRQVMQETDSSLLFETRDGEQEGAWIHRSYLTK